ncbi:hypothetical protein ACIQUM_15680 [Amycolatopsis azurea]|uniref:hypothetical protein n=1 Tax=Amycolatopsis azurea TaxID=36819 RepID=UPI0038028528
MPPCSVSPSVPSGRWTTRVLRAIGLSGGRLWSGFTLPRNVSENSHAVRPSGSGTDTVRSPPVQCPP